jgi:hypothetical protein
MDEAQKKKLAFWEAINFFSINIHGERSLMEGLSRRLYYRDTAPYSSYIHHFLDEENKHMLFFGTYCQKYGGKIYPEKKISFSRSYAPGEEDFLFFARVMIFEELVDRYNLLMAEDNRLFEIARHINAYHHLDETRHLAFGRLLVQELWEKHAPAWSAETIAGIRSYLAGFLKTTWREYYNPDVYRDAGIEDPYGAHEEALRSTHGAEHRRRISEKCLRVLRDANILTEEVAL